MSKADQHGRPEEISARLRLRTGRLARAADAGAVEAREPEEILMALDDPMADAPDQPEGPGPRVIDNWRVPPPGDRR